jgi:hypothetical protein
MHFVCSSRWSIAYFPLHIGPFKQSFIYLFSVYSKHETMYEGRLSFCNLNKYIKEIDPQSEKF